MPSVVGSNGKHQNNNKNGITFSESKSNNHQLINSQEIEHCLPGLVNKMEVSSTCQHTHTLIWKVLEIQMSLRISHTKTDTQNGSSFILDIQDLRRKLLLQFNGKTLLINKNMTTSDTSKFQNSTYLLERTNNSQDSMVRLHQLLSMLEKDPSNQTMTFLEKEIHLALTVVKRN